MKSQTKEARVLSALEQQRIKPAAILVGARAYRDLIASIGQNTGHISPLAAFEGLPVLEPHDAPPDLVDVVPSASDAFLRPASCGYAGATRQ